MYVMDQCRWNRGFTTTASASQFDGLRTLAGEIDEADPVRRARPKELPGGSASETSGTAWCDRNSAVLRPRSLANAVTKCLTRGLGFRLGGEGHVKRLD